MTEGEGDCDWHVIEWWHYCFINFFCIFQQQFSENTLQGDSSLRVRLQPGAGRFEHDLVFKVSTGIHNHIDPSTKQSGDHLYCVYNSHCDSSTFFIPGVCVFLTYIINLMIKQEEVMVSQLSTFPPQHGTHTFMLPQ